MLARLIPVAWIASSRRWGRVAAGPAKQGCRLSTRTWVLALGFSAAVLAASCGGGETGAQRIERLTIVEPGPKPIVRGKNNPDIESNGEGLVARTLIDPNDQVLDVGAYVGEWSMLVSEHQPTVRIHAFEPTPDSFKKLEAKVAGTNIVPVKLALSDRAGVATFQVYEQAGIFNSFYERENLREKWKVRPVSVEVPTERLDAWCAAHDIDHVDYLKIDTEGAELVILQGAGEMLQRKAISLVQFEYGGAYKDAGATLKEIFGLLSGHGYEIYRILPDGLLHIPEWQDAHEDYNYANFLAVAG